MSDQGLREALEKKLATTDGWTVSNDTLLAMLAEHPAESAPRPVIDREAVKAVLNRRLHGEQVVDLIVELARPMPTREQISEAILAEWIVQTELKVQATPVEHCRTLADAVLALLNGSES